MLFYLASLPVLDVLSLFYLASLSVLDVLSLFYLASLPVLDVLSLFYLASLSVLDVLSLFYLASLSVLDVLSLFYLASLSVLDVLSLFYLASLPVLDVLSLFYLASLPVLDVFILFYLASLPVLDVFILFYLPSLSVLQFLPSRGLSLPSRVADTTVDLPTPCRPVNPLPSSQSSTFHVLLSRIFSSCFWSPYLPFPLYYRPQHFPHYVFFISPQYMLVPVQSSLHDLCPSDVFVRDLSFPSTVPSSSRSPQSCSSASKTRHDYLLPLFTFLGPPRSWLTCCRWLFVAVL